MLVPDKSFKMWKSTKTVMTLMAGSKEDKNSYKRAMIDAQLTYEAAKRASLKSKESKGRSRGAVAPDSD
jgi:hypothetical protein